MLKSGCLILIVLFSLFSSCTPERDTNIDRLVIRLSQEPQRLNPILQTDTHCREVYQYVMLQLGEIDPITLEMTPLLVKEIPEPQALTEGEGSDAWSYDFEILPDAVWSDGQPVTAYDYLFTLKVIFHEDVNVPGIKTWYTDVMAVNIDENNSQKFQVITSSRRSQVITALCGVEVYPEHFYDPEGVLKNYSLADLRSEERYSELIAENRALKEFGSQFNSAKYSREVVEGAGPYRIAAWETDQFLRLVKKENYWGANYPDRVALNAFPQEIIVQIVEDDVIAISQLKGQELDMARLQATTGERFAELKQDKFLSDNFDFYSPQLLRYLLIVLNNESPLLNDKRVRRALSHLVDVDRLITSLEGGSGKRAISIVYPSKSYYNPALKAIPYDPERAVALLAEAGWADSDNNRVLDKMVDGEKLELKLRFFSSGTALSERVALTMKEGAAKAKVDIDIITQAFRITRPQNMAVGDFELAPMQKTVFEGEDDFSNSWHSSNIGGTGLNFARYSNPEADKVLEELNREMDSEKRKSLYFKLQEIIYEDQPIVFLYSPAEKIIVSKKFDPLITSRRPGYLANSFKPAK